MVELKIVTNWELLGAYLHVPKYKMDIIKRQRGEDVEMCKLDMLQFWLDYKTTASWRDIVSAIQELNLTTLASSLKKKYLMPDNMPEGILQLKKACISHTTCNFANLKCFQIKISCCMKCLHVLSHL